MNIKDLKIYKNNIEDVSKLEIGEIYVLLYNDGYIMNTNLEKHDTEVILKINDIDLNSNIIYYNVILSRYIIPEDCSDKEFDQIISNWNTYVKDWWEYKALSGNGRWSINHDGSVFIKFDEYQDYLNNKTNKICPRQEEEETNG